MMRKTLAGAAFAAGLAIALAPMTAKADPINLTIGKLLEVTGPLSETGPSQDKAIKLAVAYANEQAAKAGVPIVPMICSGAHRVMKKRSLVIQPGEIVVEFLEPILASAYTIEERDALNEKVHEAMAAALPADQKPLGFPGAA